MGCVEAKDRFDEGFNPKQNEKQRSKLRQIRDQLRASVPNLKSLKSLAKVKNCNIDPEDYGTLFSFSLKNKSQGIAATMNGIVEFDWNKFFNIGSHGSFLKQYGKFRSIFY